MSQHEDDALPPAPQPQHERVWRHPSELGFAAHTVRVEQRPDIGRTGRGLLLFSIGAGCLMLLGLVVMVQPRTAETDAVGVIELTNRSVEVVELVRDGTRDHMGMVVGDGSLIITTWAAVESGEIITIDSRDGSRRTANVVMSDEQLHLAVLRVDERLGAGTGELPPLAEVATGQDVFVADGAGGFFRVGERTADGLIILSRVATTEAHVTEGAPVFDGSGRLMGLYTEETSTPCFVPIEDIEGLLDGVEDD